MGTMYNAGAPSGAAHTKREAPPRASAFHDLSDLYNPPRRKLHPMLLAGVVFAAASGLFYGAEAKLPAYLKPSRFIGGYTEEVAKAKTEGELAARIAYDGKLKLIEVAAVQWQEGCKANLQNWNNYYQAAYTRANAGYQLAAALQKQYAQVRLSTTQSSLGGEVGIANAATTFGFVLGLIDPETGQKALEFADGARQGALKKLDDAANSGITVSTDGWDVGLPDPTTLPPPVKCELPISLLPAQPSKEG